MKRQESPRLIVGEYVNKMNVQLVDSLIQVILSLSADEQLAIAEKLFANIPYPSSQELVQIAQNGGCFEFLHDEPDIYTRE